MIDWDNLLAREGSAVWRTVYRLVRNQADAEECFQETFLAALEVSNRASGGKLAGAVATVGDGAGDRSVAKALRRRRREEVADLALAESGEPGPAPSS